MNRRAFFKGLAAVAIATQMPRWVQEWTQWRHSESYYEPYHAWLQVWERRSDDQLYNYAVVSDTKWADTDPRIKQFWLEDRDYSWRKRYAS